MSDEKIVKVIDLIPGTVRPLTTIQAKSLEADTFWSQFVCKHEPVLIKGAADEWSARKHWDQPGYLESLCTEEKERMSRIFNPLPIGPYLKDLYNEMNLADCIKEMRMASDDATYSIPSFMVPKKWENDLGSFSFLTKMDQNPRVYSRRRLFMYKNASTDWHYHNVDETLTTQLAGSKRISLFRLTPENWSHYAPAIQANLHHMPFNKHMFTTEPSIIKYEGILEAGDSVYIPPFWWHGIDPVDQGIGVTMAHCFRTPLRRLGDWKEPVTKVTLQEISASSKLMYLFLLALITCSSISRKFANEKW